MMNLFLPEILNDTLKVALHAEDTLKVITLSSSQNVLQLWLPIVVVIVGGAITLTTNYFVSGWQAKKNLDKELFVMRMKAYSEICDLLSETYHVTLGKPVGDSEWVYPSAYSTYANLRKWNNITTRMVDKHLFLLDQNTYRVFDSFNHIILDHLKEIQQSGIPKRKWNSKCKEIGRRDLEMVHEKNAAVLAAIRAFIKEKHGPELENVR